ncbi:hypothetical protein TNCV_3935681 [Trichonephila clavipes]|nr:hypothetical protein TNCV_3935681 [Trichonephila clavipes]
MLEIPRLGTLGTLVPRFDLGTFGKIKFLVQLRIVRAQVLSSREETGSQNYIEAIGIYLFGSTLKSDTSFRVMQCRKSSREVDEREREMGGPDYPQGVLPQNWGRTKQTHTVTCMVLKAKANGRRKNPALSRDEFRRP